MRFAYPAEFTMQDNTKTHQSQHIELNSACELFGKITFG